MLAEEFHQSSIGCEVVILKQGVGYPSALCHPKESAQSIRGRLIRTKHPKISLPYVELHGHVRGHLPQLAGSRPAIDHPRILLRAISHATLGRAR